MAIPKTYQYKHTVSIDRELFKQKVVYNGNLTKKDYMVLMSLLTHLDARQGKKIDVKVIAEELDLKKKEVREAIENLIDEEIIGHADGLVVEDAYITLF